MPNYSNYSTLTTGLRFQGLRLVVIKGYLLIISILLTFSCCSPKPQQENGATQYDELTKKHVYVFVEHMPQYKGGENAFMADFIHLFHYEFNDHEDIQTKLFFEFVIDKKGHLTGARIRNKKPEELTNFEKAGLKTLGLMGNWKAGKHNNKNVDVIQTMLIHLDRQ